MTNPTTAAELLAKAIDHEATATYLARAATQTEGTRRDDLCAAAAYHFRQGGLARNAAEAVA